jgi:serine/threonine protein kinase
MPTGIPADGPHVGERPGNKPFSQTREKCCTGLQPGMVLGRGPQYQITQPLGAGCFAEVFKAQRKNTLKLLEVAIKVCPENEAGCGQLLKSEWTNLMTLDHPNIVRFHGVFRHHAEGGAAHPFLCIVMEFCPFGTLKQQIQARTKTLSTAGVITMAKELASAVGYMHDRGIIHGDLKSDNILITTGGATKIGDFGRSRRMGSMDYVPMGGGEVTYLPPEHGTSSSVAPSFDMWGVGLILAEVSIMELIRSFVTHGQSLYNQKRAFEILRQKVHAVHGGQMSPIVMGLVVPEPEARMTATDVYEKVSTIKSSNKLVSSLKNLFS